MFSAYEIQNTILNEQKMAHFIFFLYFTTSVQYTSSAPHPTC